MGDKKMIYDTIMCLILQVLVTWTVLGVFFDHPVWEALIEALVTQTITAIAGISFLIMMFTKK